MESDNTADYIKIKMLLRLFCSKYLAEDNLKRVTGKEVEQHGISFEWKMIKKKETYPL